MTPDFTTTPPNWAHRSCTGRHGNWSRAAKGIDCRADAVGAEVYEFDGIPDRILAHNAHQAFAEITSNNLRELEDELDDARREVHRLEDELEEAEDQVDTITRKIQAIQTTKPKQASIHPSLL